MRRSVKRSKKTLKKIEETIVAPSSELVDKVIGTDLIAALTAMDCDVLQQLAMYAKGDVVRLGLMTKDELEGEAEFNDMGFCVKESGREKALHLIPPRIRAKALMELTAYIVPKKKEASKPDGPPVASVKFYLPENGRDKPHDDGEEQEEDEK